MYCEWLTETGQRAMLATKHKETISKTTRGATFLRGSAGSAYGLSLSAKIPSQLNLAGEGWGVGVGGGGVVMNTHSEHRFPEGRMS